VKKGTESAQGKSHRRLVGGAKWGGGGEDEVVEKPDLTTILTKMGKISWRA